MERRNFGIADDVYAAGLLLAYMAFMPFCQPGSIDAPSLQRYAEICLAHCSVHALCMHGTAVRSNRNLLRMWQSFSRDQAHGWLSSHDDGPS
jgi:hypothetical protein